METMTENETLIWLFKHNIDNENFINNYELKLSKKISVDSGFKNYLAKEIASIYNENNILLYINEFGIWPSCENMYFRDDSIFLYGMYNNTNK